MVPRWVYVQVSGSFSWIVVSLFQSFASLSVLGIYGVYMDSPSKGILKLLSLDFPLLDEILPVHLYSFTYIQYLWTSPC